MSKTKKFAVFAIMLVLLSGVIFFQLTGSFLTGNLKISPTSPGGATIISKSNPILRTFHFVTTQETAVITELKFTANPGNTAVSLKTLNTLAPFVINTAYVTGLSFPIPVGASGEKLTIVSPDASLNLNASLTFVKYTIGEKTFTACAAGCTNILSVKQDATENLVQLN